MGIDLTAAARVVPLTALTSGASVSRSTYDKQTAVLQQARAQAILPLLRSRRVPVAGLHSQRQRESERLYSTTSSFGQVFEGSINSQYRITGQVTGYCTYDLTFKKSADSSGFQRVRRSFNNHEKRGS